MNFLHTGLLQAHPRRQAEQEVRGAGLLHEAGVPQVGDEGDVAAIWRGDQVVREREFVAGVALRGQGGRRQGLARPGRHEGHHGGQGQGPKGSCRGKPGTLLSAVVRFDVKCYNTELPVLTFFIILFCQCEIIRGNS